METKSGNIKRLEGVKSQLLVKKQTAEIELDRIDTQIKTVDLEIKKIQNAIPAFVKNKISQGK
jgi:chaperonin cofactor prefoldin